MVLEASSKQEKLQSSPTRPYRKQYLLRHLRYCGVLNSRTDPYKVTNKYKPFHGSNNITWWTVSRIKSTTCPTGKYTEDYLKKERKKETQDFFKLQGITIKAKKRIYAQIVISRDTKLFPMGHNVPHLVPITFEKMATYIITKIDQQQSSKEGTRLAKIENSASIPMNRTICFCRFEQGVQFVSSILNRVSQAKTLLLEASIITI